MNNLKLGDWVLPGVHWGSPFSLAVVNSTSHTIDVYDGIALTYQSSELTQYIQQVEALPDGRFVACGYRHIYLIDPLAKTTTLVYTKTTKSVPTYGDTRIIVHTFAGVTRVFFGSQAMSSNVVWNYSTNTFTEFDWNPHYGENFSVHMQYVVCSAHSTCTNMSSTFGETWNVGSLTPGFWGPSFRTKSRWIGFSQWFSGAAVYNRIEDSPIGDWARVQTGLPDYSFPNGTVSNFAYDGVAVAIIASNTGILRSDDDGVSWTQVLPANFVGATYSTTYANGRFYAINGGTLYASDDGITWSIYLVLGAGIGGIYPSHATALTFSIPARYGYHDILMSQGSPIITNDLAQRVDVRLRTFLGEHWLNPELGVPWFTEFLKKNPDLNVCRTALASVIRGVPGVTDILRLTIGFAKNTSTLRVDYTVTGTDSIPSSGITAVIL